VLNTHTRDGEHAQQRKDSAQRESPGSPEDVSDTRRSVQELHTNTEETAPREEESVWDSVKENTEDALNSHGQDTSASRERPSFTESVLVTQELESVSRNASVTTHWTREELSVEEENARNTLSSEENASSTSTTREPSVLQEEEEEPTDVSSSTTGPLHSVQSTELNVLLGRDGERHTAQQERESVLSSFLIDTANAPRLNWDVSDSLNTSRDGVSRFTDSAARLHTK